MNSQSQSIAIQGPFQTPGITQARLCHRHVSNVFLPPHTAALYEARHHARRWLLLLLPRRRAKISVFSHEAGPSIPGIATRPPSRLLTPPSPFSPGGTRQCMYDPRRLVYSGPRAEQWSGQDGSVGGEGGRAWSCYSPHCCRAEGPTGP